MISFVGVGRYGLGAVAGALAGGLLVGHLLQGVAQVAQRGGEEARERAHRRLHPAGQLGQQDLARRQGRQPGDVVGTDRPVAEHAAGDPDDPCVRPGGVEDRLRGARLVGPERDGGRSDEQRAQRLADRILGGDPHQPVLDDAVRDVLLAQRSPDLGDLLHLEAAVLGDDHRPGVGDLLAQLGDGLPFGLGGHGALLSFGTRPACAAGARAISIERPLRRPMATFSRRPTPSRRSAAHPKVEERLPRRARRRPRRTSGLPVRFDGSSPVRHRLVVGHGLRAQAVCGGFVCLVR